MWVLIFVSSSVSSADIGELYASHHGWLFTWLRKKLGCREIAADLAHDIFSRLLASRELLLGVREPRAFLTVMAKRSMVDRLRREALERAYMEELALSLEGLAGAPSPEQLLLTLEALKLIAQALAEVGDKAREAFLMHYLEGLGQGEIAEQLGVSTRMVRKYLVQCLLNCEAARPEY